MSSRGAPRGRGGSSNNGRGSGGFGSTGRGGFQLTYGPPAAVLEMGSFLHASEGDIVCESINPKVPKFNAPIYLENKTAIGKVDEILGPINQVYFTVKPQDGIVATSFKSGDKFYIGGDRLLPLEMFLPQPKPLPGTPKPKRIGGRSRGAPLRGGRGSRGGSRGAPRGRGGFSDRARGGSRGGGFSSSRGRGSGGFSSSRGRGGGGGRGSNPNFTRPGTFRGRGS